MTRERYGRGAARFYGLGIDPILRPLRPRIAALLGDRRPYTVLDVACATGALARWLARRGFRVVGVDLSPAMIQAAARRAPSVPFVCSSALALPFPDAAFDAVVLSLALHEHPEAERQAMAREAVRVVRPAGRLVIADFCEPQRPRGHVPWQVIRAIERVAGPEHRAGFVDYVAQGSLRGLLARLDFAPTRSQPSHFGCIEIVTVTKPGPRR
jgi:ubiquinone/menaquinone biosynthesis C-methylase UbiE